MSKRAVRIGVISVLAAVGLALAIGVPVGLSGDSLPGLPPVRSHVAATLAAPSTPGPVVCGSSSLVGPSTAPAGAVTIPAGDNTNISFSYQLAPNTTYWFAPGTHTLDGQFGQFQADQGDTFIGAPGAIVNGEGVNNFAFASASTGVTIENLTITDFDPPENAIAVNQDGAADWTIENNTVEDTQGGGGVGIGGTGDVVSGNCLTMNAQYGFSSGSGGGSDVTLTGNEISFNDGTGTAYGAYSPSLGVAGGGKFWDTGTAAGANTVSGNYVHDNGAVGIWMDTDNVGFNVSDNYFAHNFAEALEYEISYNGSFTDNSFVDNDWGWNAANYPQYVGGFPTSAVYLSESGSDSRVSSVNANTFAITGNVFTDNWGGIVLYENSNRACGVSNDGLCTLVNPSVYTLASCTANEPTATPSGNPDYYDNCRWKTQNVLVSENTFNFTPSNIGSDCTLANWCGFNGLFSEYGSDAPYKAWVVPAEIQKQNDVFSGNTYNGPWNFDAVSQGDVVTFAQWQAGYADQNGSGITSVPQDAGSTFNGSAPPPTTTTTVAPTTTTTTKPPAPTTTTKPPTPTTTTTPTETVTCKGTAPKGATSYSLTCTVSG